MFTNNSPDPPRDYKPVTLTVRERYDVTVSGADLSEVVVSAGEFVKDRTSLGHKLFGFQINSESRDFHKITLSLELGPSELEAQA